MSRIPTELMYTSSHEWVRKELDGSYTIGITEHAQELLGDMVFIELPDVGDDLSVGDDCGVAESVKAASDIYAPLSGEVTAINEALEDSPELVNNDAYGDGWFYRIMPNDQSEFENLLDAEAYQDVIDEE